jgi:hypothetical protein
MKRSLIICLAIAALLGASATGFAQTGGATTGQTPVQGFSVETLIQELALFIPEDLATGLAGARGFGGGAGGPQGAGQPGGAATQAPAGNTAAGKTGAGQAAPQMPQLDFTRDTKLFLTKAQIAKILPIMTSLRENPLPTPTKAKKVQADIDAILTAAQKAEYATYQTALQKQMAAVQKLMGGQNGQGQQQGTPPQGTPPAGMGPGGDPNAAGGGAPGGGAGTTTQAGKQMSQTEMRQNEIDQLIKALQASNARASA